MEDFDDLFSEFNSFFGKSSINESFLRLKRMMENNKFEFGGFNNELGEPDSVKEFEVDGVIFIESIWQTETGKIIKVETKEDVEFTKDFFNRHDYPIGKRKTLTLEEQLELALKSEDYERCAELRDKIKERDSK